MAQPQLIQIALESGATTPSAWTRRVESGFSKPRAAKSLSSGRASTPSSKRTEGTR
jgi:hypothetical protein